MTVRVVKMRYETLFVCVCAHIFLHFNITLTHSDVVTASIQIREGRDGDLILRGVNSLANLN